MQFQSNGDCGVSGDRYLLDTNAVIALLRGNKRLAALLADAVWIGISVITVLEYRAFKGLVDSDRRLFSNVLQRVAVVDLLVSQNAMIDDIIELRKTYNLKLPDAIIAASAANNKAVLITADKILLKKKNIRSHTY